MSSCWEHLPGPLLLSQYAVSNPVFINNNDIVVCCKTGGVVLLQKYDIHKGSWLHIVDCARNDLPNLNWNEETNEFYMYKKHELEIYNVETKKFKRYATILDVYAHQYTIVNGDFHVIGGYISRDHMIWDPKTERFISQYTFPTYEWDKCLENAGCVYVASRNMLLLFGGYDAGIIQPLDAIWKYDLMKKQWKKVSTLPLALQSFGFALTFDEKYIIIFGGMSSDFHYNHDIWIMNVDTFDVKKSKIKCPGYDEEIDPEEIDSEWKAVVANDRNRMGVVVTGFIRKCWLEEEIVKNLMFPPYDVIQLIKTWCVMDNVHLISREGDHWRMSVTDLLNSV